MVDENFVADVVVIGSGVAGALSAYSLAKKGFKVLILEAGGRINRADIVQNFTKTANRDFSAGYPNFSNAPRPDWSENGNNYIENIGAEKLQIEYLRVLGGTTWHWNANAIRLQPVEMKMKSKYGVGVDWAISYKEIEPFYCVAEKKMGVAGDENLDNGSPRSAPFPLPAIPYSYCDKIIANYLKKIGIEFVSRPVARNSQPYQGRSQCQGFGTCAPICPSGAQYSAMVHIEMAVKLGVQIVENARVDSFKTNENGEIISAVGSRADGTKFNAQGKIFILAANAIESPKILLMSANEHYQNGIANSSGQVGRNFMEHQGMNAQFILPKPAFSGRGPQNITASYSFRDGEFRSKRAGFAMSVNNVTRLHEITDELIKNGIKQPDLDVEIRKRAIHQVEIETQMEQLPDFKNGIKLNWEKLDSSGQPQIQLHYSLGEYERAGLSYIEKTFKEMATALSAQKINISPSFGHHHPMGMTRMGNDAKNSVVDANCRAHDHKNLFILSSSVFPTGGTANPTLTIAALSLRATEYIASIS